ncbi:MAG: energy transducer TonB, partial [Candidatus Omnitrophica bacterium]|nr:energy transducer TonB [Candidatus Omnitrophota bacterium]
EPERPLDAPAAVSVPPSPELLREVHSTDPAEAAMLRYQDTVKQRIEQFRRYPESARQQHREGTIEVVFTVNRDGAAGEIALLRSSASNLLDAEAIATVKRASPFLPIPPDISANRVTMRVAVVFSLR